MSGYSTEPIHGHIVASETREADGQVLVTVRHGSDLIKLLPVDTDEELSQWFWHFVEEFGGEKE